MWKVKKDSTGVNPNALHTAKPKSNPDASYGFPALPGVILVCGTRNKSKAQPGLTPPNKHKAKNKRHMWKSYSVAPIPDQHSVGQTQLHEHKWMPMVSWPGDLGCLLGYLIVPRVNCYKFYLQYIKEYHGPNLNLISSRLQQILLEAAVAGGSIKALHESLFWRFHLFGSGDSSQIK